MCPLCCAVAPRITPFAMPHVMVNARVQISCVIEEGDPPLTIRWFRNGRPLHAQSSASSSSMLSPLSPLPSLPTAPLPAGLRVINFNAYSSILTVDHVSISHGGNYSCLAENAAGIAVHAALLQVSGMFHITVPSNHLLCLSQLFNWFVQSSSRSLGRTCPSAVYDPPTSKHYPNPNLTSPSCYDH